MQTCEIGDVVAWSKMSERTLFSWADSHYLKINSRLAARIASNGAGWFDEQVAPIVNSEGWEDCEFKVVALDVSANAMAPHLHELVERFEAHHAIRIEGDAPHHGYVNTDAAHMPKGIGERLRWDARLAQRGERDES